MPACLTPFLFNPHNAPSPPPARSDVFDVDIFTQRLAARGVRVSVQAPNPADVLAVKVGSYNDLLFVLNTTYSSQQHLRQGPCPAWWCAAAASLSNACRRCVPLQPLLPLLLPLPLPQPQPLHPTQPPRGIGSLSWGHNNAWCALGTPFGV